MSIFACVWRFVDCLHADVLCLCGLYTLVVLTALLYLSSFVQRMSYPCIHYVPHSFTFMYIYNIKCCTYICETYLQCEALCKCNLRRALYKSNPFVFNAWSGRTNRTKVSLPSDQYLKRCSLKGRKETSQIQSLLNEQHCDQEKCLERPSGWVTVAHTTWAAEAPLSLVGYYTFAAWHSSAFFSTFAGCLIFEIIMVKKHISVVDTEKSERKNWRG